MLGFMVTRVYGEAVGLSRYIENENTLSTLRCIYNIHNAYFWIKSNWQQDVLLQPKLFQKIEDIISDTRRLKI